MRLVGYVVVALIWVLLCGGIGFGAMFIGPGVVTLVAGLWLGLWGTTVHLIAAVLRRKLHWSYAGLLVGAIAIAASLVVTGGQSVELILVAILFTAFSLISTIVFPIADYALRRIIKRERNI